MKRLNSMFVYLVILQSCDGAKKTLPVLILDHDAVMSSMTIEANPFKVISSKFFTELASNAIKRTQCVIIFVEDTLCTEDISTKDNLGTPFYNLQKGIIDKKVVYIPSVSEPYDLLRQTFEPRVSNIFHLGSEEKLNIKDNHRHVYVYFQDDSEMSRSEKLRKHDMLMQEVYFTVRQIKAGPVVAFYTGKWNSVSLARLNYSPRTYEKPMKEKGVMIVTPDALFRLTGVFSSANTRRSTFEETPVVEFVMRTRRTLSTTMLITDFHLQFNFEFEKNLWKLTNVALLEAGEEVGRTETDISAPWQRSYYCSEPIIIQNLRDGSVITIPEYQIEPLQQVHSRSVRSPEDEEGNPPEDPNAPESPTEKPPDSKDLNEAEKDKGEVEKNLGTVDGKKVLPEKKKEGLPENKKNVLPENKKGVLPLTPKQKPGYCFSSYYNCSPYFNIVILTGLLVFFIFTVISFWGIIMLFNCGRNDRYDDPNQKPLVIAQEATSGF